MKADILRPAEIVPEVDEHGPTGYYQEYQDPYTGEITHIWVETEDTPDDPDTPGNETRVGTIWCEARSPQAGGIRGAVNSETFGLDYQNMEYVRLRFSAKYIVTKRDRITNIRDGRGNLIYLDEEKDMINGMFPATVFNVMGVVPQMDPFGKHTENMALLERAGTNA
jgi:hypothetical protein